MFNSISKATPTSTVTSSFVADQACTIVFGVTPLAVRINGTALVASTYTLIVNDKIEVDVTSPAAKGYAFFAYTYNGNSCSFAVVSNSGTTRPTLRSQYRNQWYYDSAYTVTSSTIYNMNSSGTISGVQTQPYLNGFSGDQVVIISASQSGQVYMLAAGGTRVGTWISNSDTTDPYLSYAWLYNGATASNDIYFLTKKGNLHKYNTSETKTVGVVNCAGATQIFSDGINIWFLGPNILASTDTNMALLTTYTVTYNFIAGCSLGGNNFFITRDGKFVKQVGSTFSVIRTAQMFGEPCVYQNQIVVPVPDEYLLLYYDFNGTLLSSVDTGNYLPFACLADKTNMAVASYNTPDVMWFTGSTMVVKTFPVNVTYAQPNDGSCFIASYFGALQTTAPPDPAITGISWPTQNPPVNVNTGSGDSIMTTVGDPQRVATPDGVVATVMGTRRATTITSGQRIQVKTRSALGRKSVPVVIGSYAFDYLVVGRATSAFSSQIDVPNQIYSQLATFTITVPSVVVNAPVALSYGNLKINGTAYNGSQLVNANDTLVVTFDGPAVQTPYASVLTIADSQYGLTVNSAAVNNTDLENFVDYSSSTVQSTFQVTETGTYHLPDYTNASATVNGVAVSFPAAMNANDTVVMTHIITSSYRYDERFTILMGPNFNYKLTSRTLVHDVPNPLDFGTVHLGIPRFPSIPDGSGTISGLSPNWQSTLQTPFLQFSVNGGPYADLGLVKNGDVVTLSYTVQNLWDGTRPVQVNSLAVGGLVDFGTFEIDPPLGDYIEPRNNMVEEITNAIWEKFQPHIELEIAAQVSNDIAANFRTITANVPLKPFAQVRGNTANTARFQADGDHYYLANVGGYQPTADHYYKTNAGSLVPAENRYYKTNAGSLVPGADHYFLSSIGTATTPHTIGASESMASYVDLLTSYTPTQTPSFVTDANATWYVQSAAKLAAEFTIQSTYTSFIPFWYYQQNYRPNAATVAYLYQADKGLHFYYPNQYEVSEKVPHWAPTVPWNEYDDDHPRWKALDSNYPVIDNYLVNDPGCYKPSPTYLRIVDFTALFPTPELMPMKVQVPDFGLKTYYPAVTGFSFVGSAATVRITAIVTAFFSRPDIKAKIITPVFGSETVLAFQPLPGWIMPKSNMLGQVIASVAINDTLWATQVPPTQVGGYATQQAAEDAASVYTNTLEIDTYQQPEGSFSFVIQRSTDLTCPVINTGLVAVSWLLGGG